MTECLQKWLLLRFEDDIILGQDRRSAAAKGGRLSSTARKQKGEEDRDRVIAQAKEMLASGRKKSDVVNVIARRADKTAARIRQILREGGL